MAPLRLWAPSGTALVVAMACAALAWRDCMLLAISLVLAHRLFLLGMDRGTPWRALAAAVHALSAGLLTAGAGVALMAGITAAWLGWWQPTAEHASASLLLLLLGALCCCLARKGRAETWQELRPWLWLLGGSVLATEAYKSGMTIAPCLFVFVVGVAMLWAGWQLATRTASALLRAGACR